VTEDILSVYSQELIHCLKKPWGLLQQGSGRFSRRKKMTLQPRELNQLKRRRCLMSRLVTLICLQK